MGLGRCTLCAITVTDILERIGFCDENLLSDFCPCACAGCFKCEVEDMRPMTSTMAQIPDAGVRGSSQLAGSMAYIAAGHMGGLTQSIN